METNQDKLINIKYIVIGTLKCKYKVPQSVACVNQAKICTSSLDIPSLF
jgi:hypothetical protein